MFWFVSSSCHTLFDFARPVIDAEYEEQVCRYRREQEVEGPTSRGGCEHPHDETSSRKEGKMPDDFLQSRLEAAQEEKEVKEQPTGFHKSFLCLPEFQVTA